VNHLGLTWTKVISGCHHKISGSAEAGEGLRAEGSRRSVALDGARRVPKSSSDEMTDLSCSGAAMDMRSNG
jgi:hypothetical protein